jgi:hypothetical protein
MLLIFERLMFLSGFVCHQWNIINIEKLFDIYKLGILSFFFIVRIKTLVRL